jgi:hypothetical protein
MLARWRNMTLALFEERLRLQQLYEVSLRRWAQIKRGGKLPLGLRPILHLLGLSSTSSILNNLLLVLCRWFDVLSTRYPGDDYRFVDGLVTLDSGKRLGLCLPPLRPPLT